ncbi:unnamed protein product [Mortierella alpina]
MPIYAQPTFAFLTAHSQNLLLRIRSRCSRLFATSSSAHRGVPHFTLPSTTVTASTLFSPLFFTHLCPLTTAMTRHTPAPSSHFDTHPVSIFFFFFFFFYLAFTVAHLLASCSPLRSASPFAT